MKDNDKNKESWNLQCLGANNIHVKNLVYSYFYVSPKVYKQL